jgi:hypothetical protein
MNTLEDIANVRKIDADDAIKFFTTTAGPLTDSGGTT